MIRGTASLERLEALAFKRQQTAFSVLTLFVLAVLLVLHTLFASLLGEPSPTVVVLLGVSFSVKLGEIIWLQGSRDGITELVAQTETILSIVGIFLLSFLLALFTNRDDPPYFALLSIAILQSAYHLGLIPTVATIVAAIGMMFAWVQHYFAVHPPPRPSEYLESGMVAVIYSLTGPLVWYLVNQLRRKEARLYQQMRELESTREKLVAEEKLSAVGRFASGIAHEIRNPVAMIGSALATASRLPSETMEREEMFAIAQREASRLEKLTGEFLTYARPVKLQLSQISLADIADHISDLTRMRSSERDIKVKMKVTGDLHAEVDSSQIEAALLNLCLNALDATADRGNIELRCRGESEKVYIDIENSGPRISDVNLKRIFEPFFTTKPAGTGLGLAIARRIAIAHGGEIAVTRNRDGEVVFTMELSKHALAVDMEETAYGKDSDR